MLDMVSRSIVQITRNKNEHMSMNISTCHLAEPMQKNANVKRGERWGANSILIYEIISGSKNMHAQEKAMTVEARPRLEVAPSLAFPVMSSHVISPAVGHPARAIAQLA